MQIDHPGMRGHQGRGRGQEGADRQIAAAKADSSSGDGAGRRFAADYLVPVAERQEFLDRYFVFSQDQQYETPHDYSRSNGLVEEIRQSLLAIEAKKALEALTMPKPLQGHGPTAPLPVPFSTAAPEVAPP